MPDRFVPVLILSLSVAAAPLVIQLPAWVIIWCAVLWGYLLMGPRRDLPMPGKKTRLFIFISGLGAVLIQAGLSFDGGDFINLLAVMSGIKPLEVRTHRDRMVTILLSYFLVITSLFVFESLAMTVYLFFSVFVTTSVLIQINHDKGGLKEHMGVSFKIIMRALPLTVALFILFPRTSGVFLGAPWKKAGQSGFSSVLSIGDVSRLILVDRPAFNVEFKTRAPDPEGLYWRGIVFQRFDGRTWHPPRKKSEKIFNPKGDTPTAYTVLLEPGGHSYLFALDIPISISHAGRIMNDHTIMSRRPVRKRLKYNAASHIRYRLSPKGPPDDKYLQLPDKTNPKSRALGNQWLREAASANEIIEKGLSFYKAGSFHYTLSPGRPGSHAIDAFLFEKKKGFCEHFASSFVFLMRSAGVPARIVGGYLGGEWNPVGNYLKVRQSDAHAWAEVWLKTQGWVRIDPTLQVAPERILEGIEKALPMDLLPAFLLKVKGSYLLSFMQSLQYTWDAVNTRWDIWFMGFSAQEQFNFLKLMGIHKGTFVRWGLFLLLLVGITTSGIVFFHLKGKTHDADHNDPAQKFYDRFLAKLKKIGIQKIPSQGPMDFAESTAAKHEGLKKDIDEITDLYVRIRYGREKDPGTLNALKSQVMRFHPRKMVKKATTASHLFADTRST